MCSMRSPLFPCRSTRNGRRLTRRIQCLGRSNHYKVVLGSGCRDGGRGQKPLALTLCAANFPNCRSTGSPAGHAASAVAATVGAVRVVTLPAMDEGAGLAVIAADACLIEGHASAAAGVTARRWSKEAAVTVRHAAMIGHGVARGENELQLLQIRRKCANLRSCIATRPTVHACSVGSSDLP